MAIRKEAALKWLGEAGVNIITVVVVVVIVLGAWILIAFLYPDEWFANIPRFILDLIKAHF